jgi:GrpB-like predicted nucleotidyltransferase (UPF0157 family)
VAYDPDWPRRFDRERTLLERVLAPWLFGGVHHIGSTAVPGLVAKPIIDMMAGVRDFVAARAAISVLSGQGYAHAPHRPEAYRFSKPPSPNWYECTHHLHLTEPGSDLWRERLAFRDALRADPALRDEYQALKERLARVHGADLPAYTADKGAIRCAPPVGGLTSGCTPIHTLTA